MSFAPRTPSSPAPYESSGGRLVTLDGRALPLVGASLAADAKGGLVRITLEQTFRNPHDEPLRVTYSLPLPADGAVSGFAFRIGEERVVGQVDAKQRARQRFEDAILEGRTAAILDQERSSLFTQEVGNVPPRTQVICEVQIDQKLTWLPDGAWEWRFPTVVAPRYLGAQGRVADHAKVSVDVADGELPVKLALSMSIRDRLPENARPESPSHTLHSGRGLQRTDVTFADERGAGLDRDVVVRWRVSGMQVGTELDVSRPASGLASEAAYGLLTLVPPSVDAKMAPLPRDLIVLLDTSGSMSGSPLDQARRVTAALVDSLTEQDQLELIEFSNSPRRWKRGAVNATEANRRDAQAWLARLRASGGTEMKAGILEALAPLRGESQRQVILITDGQIGFEHEILDAISKRLPKGSRVHTVGVGSGVNRSLTLPAARAGRGVELIIGIGEDAEPFVQRLFARTNAPLLTDVEISGSAVLGSAPARIPDLFGGSPALVSLKLRPEGGEVIIRSRSADGDVEDRVMVRPTTHGEGSHAVTTLYAREVVEDLELGVATGGNKAELDREIERFGIDFQISTRMTSWVAVSARQMVDPRAPRRTETMPQALPFGMSAEGLGLRSSTAAPMGGAGAVAAAAPMGMKGKARSMAAPVMSKLSMPRQEEAERSRADDKAATGSFAAVPPAEADEPAASYDGMSLDEGDAEELNAPADRLSTRTGGIAPPARRSAPESKRDEGPPPPPKNQKKEGLVDLAKRLFQRSSEKQKDESSKVPAPGAAPKAPEPAPAATRRLNGKLRRQGKRLIIEIDVTSPIKWAPGGEARLELSDGTTVKAPVVMAMTTAEGEYGLGLIITLVLEVDERVGEPATIHLSNGNEVLEIVL
ncbi:MAG: VIT domain-containing protein [Archangium sp.]|nr:VIT domain-containing protein [Archangium sp.]